MRKSWIEHDTFISLKKLYNDLKNLSKYNKKKKVVLIERCLHAQHIGGYVFNLDIEMIRNNLLKELKSSRVI